MGYIDETFKRANTMQIRSFLLYGTDEINIDDSTYEQRLKNALSSMNTLLEKLYPDELERDDAFNDFNSVLAHYADIYTEIGIKAGARILYDLLLSNTNTQKAGS